MTRQTEIHQSRVSIKMPRELFKKYLPTTEFIKNHKNLQFLGDKLHDPNLWHLNRRSVSIAFAVGLFAAWIPVPGQMAISATGAFYFRGNLPVAIALVWLTNPLTMPPLFYFAYLVGLNVLNLPASAFSVETIFLSGDILIPFLTGCLVIGILCSTAGYFGIQYFWYYNVMQRWTARKNKRLRNNS